MTTTTGRVVVVVVVVVGYQHQVIIIIIVAANGAKTVGGRRGRGRRRCRAVDHRGGQWELLLGGRVVGRRIQVITTLMLLPIISGSRSARVLVRKRQNCQWSKLGHHG